MLLLAVIDVPPCCFSIIEEVYSFLIGYSVLFIVCQMTVLHDGLWIAYILQDEPQFLYRSLSIFSLVYF